MHADVRTLGREDALGAFRIGRFQDAISGSSASTVRQPDATIG